MFVRVALAVVVRIDECVRADASESESHALAMKRVRFRQPLLRECGVEFAAIFERKNARLFIVGEAEWNLRLWRRDGRRHGRRRGGARHHNDE